MFGIGGTELLIIGVFAFIIFGPEKLPEIARTASKAINMFKRTQEDMERMVRAEMAGLDLDGKSSSGSDAVAEDKDKDSPAEKTTKKPSTASSLYGLVDDEEEDEE